VSECVCVCARTLVGILRILQVNPECALVLGLNTILLVPILYGVWHTKGRSRGGRILPNSRAIVLQQCGQCRRAGRKKGRLTRAQTTRNETMSCQGQVSARTLVGILSILQVRSESRGRGNMLTSVGLPR